VPAPRVLRTALRTALVEEPAKGDNGGVGVVVAAIASSVVTGAATGALLATAGRGHGFRARQSLRGHTHAVRQGGASVAAASVLATLACVLTVSRDRMGLALTCFAATLLIALASWLLLVEEDDDYPGATPDEPEWWPAFERELDEWKRSTRVPAGRDR
jgi:hypothetical protein